MNKKIMVVDNHPLILKFMKDLLVKEGYQVSTAKDGLSALDVLKTYTPDVIFIDLIMPNINGEKLCQIIRSMPRLKDVGIIILSAIAAEQALDYAALGANACVAKGSLDQMAQHIFSALDQLDRRTTNSMPGTVIGLEGVNSREITKELLSYEKHSDVILNSMSEGILEVTTESRVVYANPAAIALIGMPEEKVIASDVTQLFHETDRQKIRELLKKRETISQIVSDDSTVILSGRQVSMKVLPVTDGDSKAVIVILNDVSERKRIEEQLQLAQKIEAIATLAGGIAHDFNNLLMTIQGNISVMLLDIDPSHPHYERLKNTEKQVQSGAKLTRQLLGYARKGEYEVRPINLNQLVEETAETFGRTKKEITIHRDLCEDLFALQADEGQIEQVLLNLFVNAADAMPDGGKLFLKTMKTNHKEIRPMVYDLKPGHYVRLSVTDTGAGMDKKTLEHIFDPFFTTKEMGKGTGLGLASAYRIVKGHGGFIDAGSKQGEGTTFNIYLPATDRKPVKHLKGSEQIVNGIGTILFVDDEPMVLDLGVSMLKKLGYMALEAKGGREAVEVYRENKDDIDIVILDMIMPGMGGGEAYERLKEINPNIKVLLSSGYGIDGRATDIVNRGCDGFIQKPFRIKDLSQKIRSILER